MPRVVCRLRTTMRMYSYVFCCFQLSSLLANFTSRAPLTVTPRFHMTAGSTLVLSLTNTAFGPCDPPRFATNLPVAAAGVQFALALLSFGLSLQIWVVNTRGTISDARERESLPCLCAGYIAASVLSAAASITLVTLAQASPGCEKALSTNLGQWWIIAQIGAIWQLVDLGVLLLALFILWQLSWKASWARIEDEDGMASIKASPCLIPTPNPSLS